MAETPLLERMHRECCQCLQAVGPSAAGEEEFEETRGGVLPPGIVDLSVQVVAFYATWYLIAGALGFLGNRALSKLARKAGWEDPAAKGLRDVETALQRMETALWALTDSIKEGRQADTRTLQEMVDQLKPALDQVAERLRGQVGPGDVPEVQAAAIARLQRLQVPKPVADQAGPQAVRIVVNGLQAKPGPGLSPGQPAH
jgi:hypothetical protein